MMKKQNKKRGFTIVELTIVVSVIAILSAVLIPTFAGIIKKANQSADEAAVRQMNTAIAAAAEDELSFADAVAVLDEAGYNSVKTLTPVSKGFAFYWDAANKTIVLVNTKDNTVAFPKNYANAFQADWKAFDEQAIISNLSNIDVASQADIANAIENGAKKVTLTSDLKMKDSLTVESDLVIDLNGYELNASKNQSRPFNIDGNVSLTIDATGAEISNGRYGLVNIAGEDTNATVIINGGTFTANDKLDNGAFLRVRDGASANITLNNVTYTDNVDDDSFVLNFNGSNGVNLTVNGGTFDAAFGFQASQVTVSDATITTDGYAFVIEAATENTITNCTITAGAKPDGAPLSGGAIIATNGAKVTADNCDITTNGDIVAYFVANSGGEIVATNAQGTTTAGSTLPAIDEGATIKITVNGEVKVNSAN